MRFPKLFVVLSVALVAAFMVTSCGPAVPPTTETEEFALALPRITLSYDADGNPSLVGLDLEEIGPLLKQYMGIDLNAYISMMRIDPFWVSWMTNANVQHIEIQYGAGGALIFVNGKALPHLAWTDESFSNVGTMVESFMGQTPWTGMIKTFLPFVQRTGIGVVLMFPKQEGAAEIPLREPSAIPQIKASEAAPSVIARAEVAYDNDGVPSLLGISSRDLSKMTGMDMRMVELPPSLIAQLKALNVQHVELRARSDGVWIFVNGMELPHIAWNDALLTDTAGLYAQLNPGSPLIDLVNFLLPSLVKTDVDLLVRFPVAEGAMPIPRQHNI
ncbi:MAG: hypothetical protein J7M34_04460 [Anaerolineae bacterium]|nr:hypothetical protein [Anaerolineae bacterium]